MPISLASIALPERTAVVTMEVQRGVVGDLAALPELASAAREAGTIQNVGRLCAAARRAGVRVVHCTAVFRADGAGSKVNSPLQAVGTRRNQGRLNLGEPGAELMPELGADPGDIELPRLHGLTPFIGTSLDQVLRNLGVSTVVAAGNSVNVGILGLALNAVDLGYSVVVPRDAVAGVPTEYVDAVLSHTIAVLGTVCTTDDLVDVWHGPPVTG